MIEVRDIHSGADPVVCMMPNCGHEWYPRRGAPTKCPKCKTPLAYKCPVGHYWRNNRPHDYKCPECGDRGTPEPVRDYTPVEYHCERCGHDWAANSRNRPDKCARCKSDYWATPPREPPQPPKKRRSKKRSRR